jgi:hypothetical protein
MYYCDRNFKTKKLLKEAVTAGKIVTVFSPEPHERQVENGTVCVGGGTFLAVHTWYATVTLKHGVIVGVK